MEADNPAEQFVDTEVPTSLRPLIPSALRRAYLAADAIIERHVQFQTPGGKYQRGDIIMLAVSCEIEQLIKTNALPFEGTWESFARLTGRHYVILTPRARITTSQVDDPSRKPRYAVHRANYSEINIKDLFEEVNVARVISQERRLLHILHGYQDLKFAHLAYPHPDENRHIYWTPNLLRGPHEISSGVTPPEGPKDSPDPEALESIERHLRDDDD